MMSKVQPVTDKIAIGIAEFSIKWRWLILMATVVLVFGLASGARFLTIDTNYRAFFSDDNPELIAFEDFQAIYTKNDNFLFVVQSSTDDVFSQDVADAVEMITKESWQIPFALRVDSISNFQHTWAEEDDLIVEDLVVNGKTLSAEEFNQKRSVALAEPLLKNQLISPNSDTTGVNVVMQYPEKDYTEVTIATAKAREIRAMVQEVYPDLRIAISGISMMNNSFSESGQHDMENLYPIMYGVLLVMMLLMLRSISGTVTALLVIAFSSMAAMGVAGFFRVGLTPVSFTVPTIILTLAIADSVHILMSLRTALQEGLEKTAAIIEAIRVNFLAVSITSVTTIVGFMSLNFSDSPPFWHLGNLTAVGIFMAWLLSVFFLPAMISLLPLKTKKAVQTKDKGGDMMEAVANFVITRYRGVLLSTGLLAVGLTALVPTIELNDVWTKYFDERIEFRRDSDFVIENLGGLYPMEFSLHGQGEGGISEPEFLNNVDKFAQWLRSHEHVAHVYSLSDIMKRLNKNMHGDDEAYYRIPDNRDLSAQYLLLYELSLPYGLDLNDRLNLDKSATRVTATLRDISTVQTRQFIADAEMWLKENTPEYMHTSPTGAVTMFSYIAKRNIESMLRGNLIAVLVIALIMILALRSFSLGALSLIPNALPILMTFGIWALLVGRIGMAAATVTATSLGIIVDNTVHFLTKYQRGRNEKRFEIPEAIRYAFRTVGMAVVANALILAFGFAVLATSTFKVNAESGSLMAIAISVALIVDLLLLPALLMLVWKRKQGKENKVNTVLQQQTNSTD